MGILSTGTNTGSRLLDVFVFKFCNEYNYNLSISHQAVRTSASISCAGGHRYLSTVNIIP